MYEGIALYNANCVDVLAEFPNHYCPVKILDLEINRVDHHPLGR